MALTGSTLGPLVAWLWPASEAPASTGLAALPGAYVLETLPALAPGTSAASRISPGTLLLVGWVAVSGFLLLVGATLALRLALRLRDWPERRVDGVAVRVSKQTGPAAMGLLRGQVVVPEWALSLPAAQRRLLVLHEAEHVRARDPQLALAGLVVCALVPWNLPLWWQLRRLRLAVEMDCDARVLRRAPDPRRYGSLLVTVGQRKAHLGLALAESRSMLERRIRMITNRGGGRRTAWAAGLGLAAGLVVAVACETPGPTTVQAPQRPEPDLSSLTDWPRSENDCIPVILLNGDRIENAEGHELELSDVEIRMFSALPPGVEPRTEPPGYCRTLWLLTGDASPAAEARARRLAEGLAVAERLAAAEGPSAAEGPLKSQAVADSSGNVRTESSEGSRAEDISEEPTFTPMTVRPQLLNPDEVREALDQFYPPLLKDAGIGGTASVWFLIDPEGLVRRALIRESAGHDALDQAALKVAGMMAFTPAYNREERVPVWVALDITFESTAVTDERRSHRGVEDRANESSGVVERERHLRDGLGVRDQEVARDRVEPERESRDQAAGPAFTPMTRPPELRNHEHVSQALTDLYPPVLRDAGIGGTAKIWIFIDRNGAVQDVRIDETSGYDALDAAALRVGRQMTFEPARNGGEAVPVWISLDVTFQVE